MLFNDKYITIKVILFEYVKNFLFVTVNNDSYFLFWHDF
jgi:hypothetical protein